MYIIKPQYHYLIWYPRVSLLFVLHNQFTRTVNFLTLNKLGLHRLSIKSKGNDHNMMHSCGMVMHCCQFYMDERNQKMDLRFSWHSYNQDKKNALVPKNKFEDVYHQTLKTSVSLILVWDNSYGQWIPWYWTSLYTVGLVLNQMD